MTAPLPANDFLADATSRTPFRAQAAILAANLIWLVQALVLADVIAGWLATPHVLNIYLAAVIFAGSGLIRTLLGFYAERSLYDYADNFIAQLREKLTLAESLRAWRGSLGSAATASLAAEQLERFSPYLTRYGPARLRVAIVPVLILFIAFSFSWAAGFILLISGPLIPVFMVLVGMAARDASAKQLAHVSVLNDTLGERFSALVDIRLLGAGGRVLDAFAAQSNILRAKTMAVLKIAFLSSMVLELFAAIGVAMMAVYVGFSLLGVISFGTYGGNLTPFWGIYLLLLAPEFFQPMRDLAAAWHDKADAEAVAKTYVDWATELKATIWGTGGIAHGDGLWGPVTCRGLGVQMPDGQEITYPPMRFTPGSATAITGPSGCGKTTLLLTLAGLIPPSAGRIEIGDSELSPNNADEWRQQLAYIPQRMRFLTGSLRHNIALCAPIDHEKLEKALSLASIGDVIARTPRGLETRLGETGAGLSGGEARRVAIARALYADSKLVLADEPTADLDAETARLVTRGLLSIRESGATLIIATHDPDLMAKLDNVIDLGAPR